MSAGPEPARLYVGLMSGTSLDGVDAALCDLRSGLVLLGTHYQTFTEVLRDELLALHWVGHDELGRAASVANRLADLYAQSVEGLLADAGIGRGEIAAIGCHGQTIRHRPGRGYSLQLNNPSRLAERTGLTVVADFRNRDIAAGGQGAPLVPAFHEAVFRDRDETRAVVNIGGIANVTLIPPAAQAFAPTRGFDCGPGNMLMDAWCREHTGQSFDCDGRWAASGRVPQGLLAAMQAHPFFAATLPKSCGREDFSIDWLHGLQPSRFRPEDVQASLLELTAWSIAQAVGVDGKPPAQVLLCGGGVHNARLRTRLAELMPDSRVNTTAVAGLDPDWVEACAFAWLASQTMAGRPGNLPDVTGASGPRVLGAIYPA